MANDVTCTRPPRPPARSTGTVESDTPDPNLDDNRDDASVVIVAQIPPTTPPLPPVTLPPTGSSSTGPAVQLALVFLASGLLGVLATRRREHPSG